MTGTELVLTDASDGVGTLTLNRPDRHNAISDELFDGFVHGMRALIRDTSVRCILLRGEGRSFCSGRDTSVLGHRADGESDFDFVRGHQEVRLDTLTAPKPVVGAVQGAAIGGGLEIALSADIRVAADDLRVSLPEIRYGLLPDTGGTQLLTPLIGPSRAKYLVLTGEQIDAATALEWGLVDFVVPRAELDERTLAIARQIAAADPLPLALGKQLVDRAWTPSVHAGIRDELVAQTALFASDDYRARKQRREEGATDAAT